MLTACYTEEPRRQGIKKKMNKNKIESSRGN